MALGRKFASRRWPSLQHAGLLEGIGYALQLAGVLYE